MIIVQISILTSTIDTKGPLLNLLPSRVYGTRLNCSFFYDDGPQKRGYDRKDDDEAQQVPFHSRQTFPNQRMYIGKI